MSKLLQHLENDHETEDFVRVEGDTYRSHFIVNEVTEWGHFGTVSQLKDFSSISGRFHKRYHVDLGPAAL